MVHFNHIDYKICRIYKFILKDFFILIVYLFIASCNEFKEFEAIFHKRD